MSFPSRMAAADPCAIAQPPQLQPVIILSSLLIKTTCTYYPHVLNLNNFMLKIRPKSKLYQHFQCIINNFPYSSISDTQAC